MYAQAFALHLYTNTELFEELIAPEPCLSFYREVAGYRKAASSLDRSYQVHWMQIADFGVANCLRLLDREKDGQWLKEGLSIAKAQRDYMEGLMGTSKNGDDFWYLQHIWYTYRMEQDLYMAIADYDVIPEEEWLPAMLETIERQLSIPKVCVSKDDQKKVLDRLYLLKAKGLKNQAGLQQAIDKITERLGDSDNTFAFTLQKTAIEQNAVADSGISDTVESSEANTFDILDSIFGDSES